MYVRKHNFVDPPESIFSSLSTHERSYLFRRCRRRSYWTWDVLLSIIYVWVGRYMDTCIGNLFKLNKYALRHTIHQQRRNNKTKQVSDARTQPLTSYTNSHTHTHAHTLKLTSMRAQTQYVYSALMLSNVVEYDSNMTVERPFTNTH